MNMKHQPSTPAHNLPVKLPDLLGCSNGSIKSSAAINANGTSNANDPPRLYFTRTALFSALTISLVGFGCSLAPAAFAATTDLNNSATNSQITANTAPAASPKIPKAVISDDDSQLAMALDALRLKKAVEQGIIEQSVLDDYSEQTLGIEKSDAKNSAGKTNNTVTQENANSANQISSIASEVSLMAQELVRDAKTKQFN